MEKELQTLPANDPKAPLLREAITVGESYADVLMTLRDIDTVLNTLNNRSKTLKRLIIWNSYKEKHVRNVKV